MPRREEMVVFGHMEWSRMSLEHAVGLGEAALSDVEAGAVDRASVHSVEIG